MKLFIEFLLSVMFFATSFAYMTAQEKHPQIIAHRGACGYVPEHSLAAYQLAIDLGTDYIEPDLCISKDGVFVAMHDLLLDDTTDIADHPEFADRNTTKLVDGANMTGYFVNDFTVRELKTLGLIQRVENRTKLYNKLFQIPTFEEIMILAQTNYEKSNITRGLYVELKHPSFHASLGYNMADRLLERLHSGGYSISGEYAFNNLSMVVPVAIQCFEADALVNIRNKTDLPLVLLMKEPSYNESYLDYAMTFADGIGPDKTIFAPAPDALDKVSMARSRGFYVHPFTFRADQLIEPEFNDNFDDELEYFYCCLKMDGLFTEFPDRNVDVVNRYLSNPDPSACNIDCAEFDSR